MSKYYNFMNWRCKKEGLFSFFNIYKGDPELTAKVPKKGQLLRMRVGEQVVHLTSQKKFTVVRDNGKNSIGPQYLVENIATLERVQMFREEIRSTDVEEVKSRGEISVNMAYYSAEKRLDVQILGVKKVSDAKSKENSIHLSFINASPKNAKGKACDDDDFVCEKSEIQQRVFYFYGLSPADLKKAILVIDLKCAGKIYGKNLVGGCAFPLRDWRKHRPNPYTSLYQEYDLPELDAEEIEPEREPNEVFSWEDSIPVLLQNTYTSSFVTRAKPGLDEIVLTRFLRGAPDFDAPFLTPYCPSLDWTTTFLQMVDLKRIDALKKEATIGMDKIVANYSANHVKLQAALSKCPNFNPTPALIMKLVGVEQKKLQKQAKIDDDLKFKEEKKRNPKAKQIILTLPEKAEVSRKQTIEANKNIDQIFVARSFLAASAMERERCHTLLKLAEVNLKLIDKVGQYLKTKFGSDAAVAIKISSVLKNSEDKMWRYEGIISRVRGYHIQGTRVS